MERLKIRVTLDDGAFLPEKAHTADAGMDLRCRQNITVEPHGWAVIDTGVHMEIPEGYVGFLKSKSGLNVKHGLRGEGVIDSGYTGPIIVKLYNDSGDAHSFAPGDKVTQLVLLPIPAVELEQVDTLSVTERGENRFGSSGK